MSVSSKPTKESHILVRFEYGNDPTYVRLTNWTEDAWNPMTAETYTSEPQMEVKLPPYTGLLKEKPLTILLPTGNSFVSRLANGEPHAPVKVRVWEVSYENSVREERALFRGRVGKTVRNPQGKPEMVRLECSNWKSRNIEVPLGVNSGHQCFCTFGNQVCDPDQLIDVENLKETGTISAINAKTLTISGLSSHVDRYWHRGYVEIDGLRILIRDWKSGTSFELVREPPAEWIDQTVTVTPGCDKTVEVCRDIWDNEEHFDGVGYAIPSYEPNFEKP